MLTYGEKLTVFGSNLAYYRRLRMLSQKELAQRSNVNVSIVRDVENANLFTNISFQKICRIAKTLDIAESELFDFDRKNRLKVYISANHKK